MRMTKTKQNKILLSLILITVLTACKKKGEGEMHHKVRYLAADNLFGPETGPGDTSYTEYGDYITSLTPTHFSAKLNMMYYLEKWDPMGGDNHMISYIDDVKFHSGEEQFADFSNNREISIVPHLNSNDMIEGPGGGVFKQKEVTFQYFNFVPYYFYQELQLPAEYKDICLEQFNQYYDEWLRPGYGGTKYHCDSVKSGTMLKTRHAPFANRLFNNKYVHMFVFGNTDSTFVFNSGNAEIFPSKDFPFGGSSRSSIIRSNLYNPLTVTMPDAEESITMYSKVLFDTRGLIQVYAGKDNIPYTADDIMVYAPRFWERLKIKLEIK